MKSFINKLFGGVAIMATLGLASCINDLDLQPIDPSQETASNLAENPQDFIGGLMAKCYSSLAVSGQWGPGGGSDISGLDGGTSQYIRAIFMMNEFTTDECLWIWQDEGVYDLVIDQWSTSNANIYGTYSRLMVHIAVCNDFLRTVTPENLKALGITPDAQLQKDIDQFCLEARALRGLSYYYMLDLFGQISWAWDDMPYGVSPAQIQRADAFNRLVADLEDVRAKWPKDQAQIIYGRFGIDAVDALLAKYYLNAEVFTGTPQWQNCYDACQRVIARHEGNGGFMNSGLANCYQALFCANNDMFAPGGSLPGQNEILWSVPQQFQVTESYGATTFMIAAATTAYTDDDASGYSNSANYGLSANWKCMHAREQFARLFSFVDGVSQDQRTLMWATDEMGHKISNDEFSDFTAGYLPLKYSNVLANADGTLPYNTYVLYEKKNDKGEITKQVTMNRFGDPTLNEDRFTNPKSFADSDFPMIRLADVYLMAAEAAMNGGGSTTDGAKYASYVRQRAGLPKWNPGDLTAQNILDERGRELYWENVRRTDLVRFGRFAGGSYNWSWKGGAKEGASISNHMKLFPIPTNVIAAQPSFAQNPGY